MHDKPHYSVQFSSVATVLTLFMNFALYSVQFSRSVMSDSATPWTAGHQGPLSIAFSKQEYWGGLPFPTPLDVVIME